MQPVKTQASPPAAPITLGPLQAVPATRHSVQTDKGRQKSPRVLKVGQESVTSTLTSSRAKRIHATIPSPVVYTAGIAFETNSQKERYTRAHQELHKLHDQVHRTSHVKTAQVAKAYIMHHLNYVPTEPEVYNFIRYLLQGAEPPPNASLKDAIKQGMKYPAPPKRKASRRVREGFSTVSPVASAERRFTYGEDSESRNHRSGGLGDGSSLRKYASGDGRGQSVNERGSFDEGASGSNYLAFEQRKSARELENTRSEYRVARD